jgi:glycosyltransferase involved in cell wall biosynthesis
MTSPFQPIVIIPSYNPGTRGLQTVQEALDHFKPVLFVSDGSTDGSDEAVRAWAERESGLHFIALPRNAGKGSAILKGLQWARERGFTHALTMDADGQHPADHIQTFLDQAEQHPEAMILGRPVFDAAAPSIRVQGRRISNGWVQLETLGSGIDDSLFGFRVYPIAPLLNIMQKTTWMRRFDFDPEAVVRLRWKGIRAINLPAPVKYLTVAEGGVSHFQYLRDNVLLTGMHLRLLAAFGVRLPWLLTRRITKGH